MQRRHPGARLAGAGEGLAVDRHDRAGEPRAARQALGEGGREAAERHLERRRVEKAEDAAERVVARDPVRQGQKLPQKGLLGAAEHAMSQQVSAPHRVAAKAMTKISAKS